MSKFKKGNRVLLSTEGLRDSAVTNLGASKLAPRFIGPFKVLKTIGDAYTLDIPSSLRLHPTFYVGRLKEYRPATLHGLIPISESRARKSTSLPVLLDARATSDVAVSPSVHDQEPGVPGSSSVQAARDSTVESHSRSSPPEQHAQEQPQLPAEHRQLCSQPRPHRPGLPGRQHYLREGPPPLVDAEGQVRWLVDRIVGHEDPPRDTTSSDRVSRGIPPARKYRMRWLGFPPEQDTWEARSSLLREVPDVVQDYESMASVHPDASVDVNVLVVHENDEVIHTVEGDHDHENESVVMDMFHRVYGNESVVMDMDHRDYENESVVMDMDHHDYENGIAMRIAQHDDQANVSLTYPEYSAELGSAVENGDASGVHHE